MATPSQTALSGSVTRLLAQINDGNREAENLLVPHVYDELRRIAARCMLQERKNHTLQATALVNEAYLRLVGHQNLIWQNKAHFFAVAAKLMRQILVDHARSHRAGKRGGGQPHITLDEPLLGSESPLIDVLVLDQLIERLAALDARQAKIVELHFFGGLSFEETAHVINTSVRTVKRDWAMARAWLHNCLTTAS